MNAPTEGMQIEAATFEDGVYLDIPAERYHATERLSASGAKKILQSPMHYVFNRTHQTEPTDAMQFGTAVHCGALEPHLYASKVATAPEVNKRTNAGKDELADFHARNVGKVILSPKDTFRASACIAAVMAHPAAYRLLTGAETEGSMFWHDAEYGVACKARYDARNLGGLIDLKTCQDASPEGFGKQCANMLYHVQGAHYWSGAEHALGSSPAFFAFIAVESEPPHAVACYFIPPVAMQAGRRLMDEALARYRTAIETGRWPGYHETIVQLDLPRYALRG